LSLFHIDAGKEWRGGQRQSFFLARELTKRGYLPRFVVQPESPLHSRAAEAGLLVLPVRIRNEFDIISMLQIAREMKREKCQLVHCHDAHSAAVGSAAASLAAVPIRVLSRRVVFPIKRNVLSRSKYTKRIDAIIAVSEAVRRVLIEGSIPCERIETIPDGTDLSLYRGTTSDALRTELHLDSGDFLAGTVANLSEDKDLRTLILAAGILREKVPPIHFVVVGRGPLEAELKRLAGEIRVEDTVHFLGFRDDVPQILASLDVFVLPSLQEGLGSVILDAMACGLPVVATEIGGIPEVVEEGKTGFLIPAEDPASLADAVLRLSKDRDLAGELGRRGRESVQQNFSVQSMVDRVILLYERLAKQKGIQLKQ